MSAGTKLARALLATAAAAGCAVRIVSATERSWASATFVGARHALSVEGVDSAALDGWLSALHDADLVLPGHMVADVSVERCDGGARVTALTLVAA
ncbi:hypothetical protein [Sphingomonas sp.]|uniref:hypothetical protein n=1 Tax=Sphingomonas sp. TaxID=28214 RepID=UPI0035BBD314